MSKAIYGGINNVARKGKSLYIGVGGIARKVSKAYIGDENGIARQFYPNTIYYTWNKYSVAQAVASEGFFSGGGAPNSFYIKCTTAAPYLRGSGGSNMLTDPYVYNNEVHIISGYGQVDSLRLDPQYPLSMIRPWHEYTYAFGDGIFSRSSNSATLMLSSDCRISYSSHNFIAPAMYIYDAKTYTLSRLYIKSVAGDLQGIVASTSPTEYPENGIHTDGYWYIRQS